MFIILKKNVSTDQISSSIAPWPNVSDLRSRWNHVFVVIVVVFVVAASFFFPLLEEEEEEEEEAGDGVDLNSGEDSTSVSYS